eukprot:scaffold209570_cov17-Tisochrysis_lutea.AAC.4
MQGRRNRQILGPQLPIFDVCLSLKFAHLLFSLPHLSAPWPPTFKRGLLLSGPQYARLEC